jgi:Plasmid rolling circle replication initiator protein and truncated derivatives
VVLKKEFFMSGEILSDKNRNGQERPWRSKKIANLRYAEYLAVLQFKKAHNVQGCGDVLQFKKKSDGTIRLYQTWFCHSRLCPLCAWRRTMKNDVNLTKIIRQATQEEKGRFLFLTLTEKNAYPDELQDKVRHMVRSFNKLIKYKKVAKNLLGYVRSTEVTYNAEEDTYHHHLHVLLYVKNAYFRNSENYIPQTEWKKLWQKAMQLDYLPSVDVKTAKANAEKRKSSEVASALEVAKYEVKSSDYMTDKDDQNLKVIDVLEHALAGTRQLGYGGIMKKVKQELALEDAEDGDLVNIDGEQESEPDDAEIIVAKWNNDRKNYFIW